MMTIRSSIALALTLGLSSPTRRPMTAGPNRFGQSDRVERHLLPVVSTGPMDPAWSPDGQWIAFSMRGDIWKVPAAGGEAIALTQGPAYHFEPAWSPDGKHIALSMDVHGNLDIGIVSADGGEVQRITASPSIDIEPTWSHDGQSLYFASSRLRGFGVFRRELESGADTLIAAGIQPAVSPGGDQLAYVAPVRGMLGTGGVWVKDLPDGQPRLVHYEETEYRMKPMWTPDGNAFLYDTDQLGSNDVAMISAGGGNAIVLTNDDADEHRELAPCPSPDGTRFAFVSARAGPTKLYTADIGGGPFPSWREVKITSRRSRVPTGQVRIRVLGPDGKRMPAQIQLVASDGRSYAPDGGFHRVIAATETHYFQTGGEAVVELPAGSASIEAMRAWEYRPRTVHVNVPSNGTTSVELRLDRVVDLPKRGWYSGDTHIHDLHQGEFGLTHEWFFQELVAADLHVTNALVHMDGTRLMGRWADLTGKPNPLSTPDYLLQYGEEFRGSLGHITMLDVDHFVLPLTAGSQNTPYAQPTLDAAYLAGARMQGGLAGFPHPYLGSIETADGVGATLIPVDAALGLGDYFDVASLYSDEIRSTQVYYRLLNAGFHLPATGGTDNFSDVWRDPPPGADRTYVHVRGPLTVQSWLDGIRRGHTFASTGPIVSLDVAGHEPGDQIDLAENAPATLHVRAEATSIAPIDSMVIVVDGERARTVAAKDSLHVSFDGDVPIPHGGWIAVRVDGPSSRYVWDSYAFAQTSPVYVVRGGRQWRSAEDARFLAGAVDATWERVKNAPWRSADERERFHAALEQARSVYDHIARDSMAAAAAHPTDEGSLALLFDPQNPEWRRASPAVWYARFETTKGDFVVECVRAHAPHGSDRFYNLVRLGYYNDARFHRVDPGYIAQWGLHGDPAVNQAWRHAQFTDDPKYGSNLRGTFAFARDTAPGTSNTQLYVNLRDNTRNDRDPFAIFGRVIRGMDVLDSLYSGYGERSGSGVRQRRQGAIITGGNAYLDRAFPLLDHLIRAEIVGTPR
jgi:cyclophilin family peptidyl-prolyl cis-trans isomerase